MPDIAPLTVIGGFLGAGKTTLINHILRDADGVRYGVLVNDFGELAIDEDLIVKHEGKTIALANGCICCTIGDDLIETLMDLMEGGNPPEHLIVEASGVADPRSISELGSLNPHLSRDLTVVVVDAEQIQTQWDDERLRDTLRRQIQAANLLILNKVETAGAEQVSELNAWLEMLAPGVPRMKADRGHIPFSIFDGQIPAETGSVVTVGHDHTHADLFQTRTIKIDDPMSAGTFRRMVEDLPPSVLRAKGHVMLNGETHLFQKVGPRYSLTPTTLEGPSDKMNRIVMIGIGDLQSLSWSVP